MVLDLKSNAYLQTQGNNKDENASVISSNSLINLDYMLQSRPTTKNECLRTTATKKQSQQRQFETSNQIQRPNNSHELIIMQSSSQSRSRGQLVSPKSQNLINIKNLVKNRASLQQQPSYRTIQNNYKTQPVANKNIELISNPIQMQNQVKEFAINFSENDNNNFVSNGGVESAKLFKQFDIPIDSQATLKQLKDNYISNINEYSAVVSQYVQKIHQLSQLLNKIEFQENFRSIQDLQELFQYCREKIDLSEKNIQIEQLYYQNKRQIELKTIELSQFKSKCKKQEDQLKKLQDENRDLRRSVLAGIEERTALFKHSQTEQSKISSMKLKVDGLEQGLLTLSGDTQPPVNAQNNQQLNQQPQKFQSQTVVNESLRQNRLKTTIHVLIMENNTLKKELSYMKNQNDEQVEEINRLKKKINHLVMKIDEQNKKFAHFQQHKNAGFMELMNVKEQEILEEDQEHQMLENSGLEEFEKLKDKLTPQNDTKDIVEVKKPPEKASPTLNHEEENIVLDSKNQPRKSTFNLQGPYWKNRTNDILKQDRDKRFKLHKYDSIELFKAFQVPSLLTRDGREKRHSYEFRFPFISSEESSILSEIAQMGIHNYIETTMSLKSIEIKKNIELITREYVINNQVRRVYEFVSGAVVDYFLHEQGDLGRLITTINQGLIRILNVKDLKVWLRDSMNNYLWTYSLDAQYEQYNLSISEQGQILINLKESIYGKQFSTSNQESPQKDEPQLQNNCLLVPLYNLETDINSGVVQVIQLSENNNGNTADWNRLQYEIQIAATIVSEIMTSVLVREQANRSQYYYIGKQVQVQKAIMNLLNQQSKIDLYQAFEKDITQVFGITRVRFAFLKSDNLLWNFTTSQITNPNTQSSEYQYQELDIRKNPSLMSLTITKNQSLIFFMPYQNLDYDSRIDLDTTLPLNSILMKSQNGQTIGVLQFENKQVKNRSSGNMCTSLSDEGVMSVIRQISGVLEFCLKRVEQS
eukprot:403358461